MHKIFIDGREGTTGLQIQERLAARPELELCELPADLRKDPAARKALINEVDFVITCLPDAAARESASLLRQPAHAADRSEQRASREPGVRVRLSRAERRTARAHSQSFAGERARLPRDGLRGGARAVGRPRAGAERLPRRGALAHRLQRWRQEADRDLRDCLAERARALARPAPVRARSAPQALAGNAARRRPGLGADCSSRWWATSTRACWSRCRCSRTCCRRS